jgi:hypothetical protein
LERQIYGTEAYWGDKGCHSCNLCAAPSECLSLALQVRHL